MKYLIALFIRWWKRDLLPKTGAPPRDITYLVPGYESDTYLEFKDIVDQHALHTLKMKGE